MSSPPPAAHPDTSASFFEQMYRKSPDPWDFRHSAYERDRYRVSLAALPRHRFRHAFEPGCSVGVLTEALAPLCDQVDAIDLAPSAVQAARERCSYLSNVTVKAASLQGWLAAHTTASVDLLILSEIGYYFDPNEWRQLVAALVGPMPEGATLLAVHWLGDSSDHVTSGDFVHECLATVLGLSLQRSERHPARTPSGEPSGFRLDCWSRV